MKCGNCGKESLQPAKIPHEVQVGGARFGGELSGWRCASCDGTEVALDEITKFEHAVARHLAEHGPVNGETMRYMRKSIPLSAAKPRQRT